MASAFTLQGVEKALKALQDIGNDLGNARARTAVLKGIRVIAREIKATSPRDKGGLKRSISYKVKKLGGVSQFDLSGGQTGRRGKVGGTWFGVAGPKTSYVVTDSQGKIKVPAKYAQIVHRGHINPDGTYTPGNPFVFRASVNAGPAAIDAVISELEKIK